MRSISIGSRPHTPFSSIMGARCASLLFAGLLLVPGCASTTSSGTGTNPTATASNVGRHADDHAARSAAPVVTADIQAGIERHIEEKTKRDGGRFTLQFEGEQMHLRLVRVHTEYLANLGPQRHFACVDLVNEDGNVYDVDFFLEGDPGSMRVTETTVHKLNGKPLYVWEQLDDGTWTRIEVDDADKPLLGVVEDEDRFRFSYAFTLPTLEDGSELWLPRPRSDQFQTVRLVSSQTPVEWEVLEEREYGNSVIYMTLDREHSSERIEFIYDVHRREKAAYPAEEDDLSRYLKPERFVPDAPIFREQAEEVLEGVEGEMVRARKLYDFVIDQLRYAKYDDKYGRGNALYACNAQTGNCTDYHSYFIALARAADIPARFAIGAPIPSERDEGGITGYHCWAEFYADGKWWPIDVSESDKYSALATYYFGHHPANRVEFSRGRDLVVNPGPASGPINFLAYPVLEVAGEPKPIKPFLSFIRDSSPACCAAHAGTTAAE